MSGMIDESIISDFVAESREHLAQVEPDFLTLEQQGGKSPKEVVNRVFRAIHSIKGGAGFLAFESLKSLSHAMESVLTQVRDGKLEPDSPVMDALFAGLDRLKAMLDDIHASDRIPCDKEVAILNSILERQGVTPGKTVAVKVPLEGGAIRTFELEAESLRSAIGRGMLLYHATAYLHRDIKDQGLTPLSFLNNALSVGQVLDAFIDVAELADLSACLEVDLAVSLIFGTVLEPDLAAIALKLPEPQMTPLDLTSVKKSLGIKAKKPPTPKPEVVQAAPAVVAAVEAPVVEEAAIPAPEAEARAVSAGSGQETLRVRVDLLTDLMNQAGELVLGRNQLLRALATHRDIPGLNAILQNISQVTSELQEGIMQTRMQPIGTLFNRFPRIIRDLSRSLGKQIEIQIKGAEVELDKSIVELLSDPLTHIIRNCADHAIELPDERKRIGKDLVGQIMLHAYHEGGQVNIAISDDGRGIDPKRVIRKAIEKGLITSSQSSQMSERDIINLIFAPGFSTAEKVSDVSGRGVGMDVVRTNVEKLGGHVEVDSQLGHGTAVLLRLPLTLAIIPSMIVGAEEHRFAIPQVNVVEFVWVRAADVAKKVERIQGAEVLRLRDQLLPLVRLADVLRLDRTFRHPETGDRVIDRRENLADRRNDGRTTVEDRRQDWRSDYNVVVLRVGPNHFGVVVDELHDFEEIVVKPLSSFITDLRCFSGATILGDGRVIMILDAGGLVNEAGLHFVDLQDEERRRLEEARKAATLAARRRRSIILCAGAEDEYFAIPQDKVTRLERVRIRDIQMLGDREYYEYLGAGLPILRLDRFLSVRPVPSGSADLYLVIPKITGTQVRPPAGIVISNVIDALDVDVDLEQSEIKGPGLLGSAILQHHLTLFLDPQELVKAAGLEGE